MSLQTNSKVVTRFAPSPTGFLHIGSLRTALFNYVYAKQHGGKYVLRIEDTDKARNTPEFEKDIMDGLVWLGLQHDEFFRQSEHAGKHKIYLQKLIDNGAAYISKEKIEKEGDRAEVIRFKNPNKKVAFDDLIRGHVEFDTTELGDFVIAKSLDEPVFHFAVVADDFDEGITHVIRGEDHISNTPRQILIQEALGAPRPVYAHLPLILAEDRSKLSKRKHGEAVSLAYYRKLGYLKEALINFIGMLGWNPGNDEELLSLDDFISKFTIEKVQKGGAILNVEKLKWLNREYIKKMPTAELLNIVSAKMPNTQGEILERALPSIVDHISVFSDIDSLAASGEFNYLSNVDDYPKEKLFWKDESDGSVVINHFNFALETLKKLPAEPTAEQVKTALWDYASEKGRGQVLWPLRYALSGKDKSPDPFVLISILGTIQATERINAAIKKLS
ncbi:TPA: glutamate--tRNA ligase [Candidatus Taylorbacteria bacterium]|nr:glutamate--tRNA ligase [Candidatus Taylorbacteria bacterium]